MFSFEPLDQPWLKLEGTARDEALGQVNRYYFWLANGRDAYSDGELLMYYYIHNPLFQSPRGQYYDSFDNPQMAMYMGD